MRHNKSTLAAALMLAMSGMAVATTRRPEQVIKGRPNRRGRADGKVELAGSKADFIIVDEIPPVRTRAVVSPHPATKPKPQSASLKRMLKGKRK